MALIMVTMLPEGAEVCPELRNRIDEATSYDLPNIELWGDELPQFEEMVSKAGGYCFTLAMSATVPYVRATLQNGRWWYRQLQKKGSESAYVKVKERIRENLYAKGEDKNALDV